MNRETCRLIGRTVAFELKRFYARGSRLILTPTISSTRSDNNHEVKEKTDKDPFQSRPSTDSHRSRKSAKELLENAAAFEEALPPRRSKTRAEDIWSTGPYPEGINFPKKQLRSPPSPEDSPAESSVILFPGQGTQFVGMGRSLLQYPNVKDMYDQASSILGYNLLTACLNGPKETLDRTSVCQPAILVTSLAALQKMKLTMPDAIASCSGTAGFSVGEITALAFAGSLSFEDAVRLVKIRAEAMQLACDMTPSGMMTVFYGPDSDLKRACQLARQHCETLGLEYVDCRVANFLYPSCKVIAGNKEALDFIENHAADFKLRRLKRLPVSGAFHSRLMDPAVEVMSKTLTKIYIKDPQIKVLSNVDGKRYTNARLIAKQLPKQIVRPVCWEQIMHTLYERKPGIEFPLTYECGPGSSLKAILSKVNLKASRSCTVIEV